MHTAFPVRIVFMVVALAVFTLTALWILGGRSVAVGVNERVVSRAITVPVVIIEAGEEPALRKIRVER